MGKTYKSIKDLPSNAYMWHENEDGTISDIVTYEDACISWDVHKRVYYKNDKGKWKLDIFGGELIEQLGSEKKAQEMCDKLNKEQEPLNNDKVKIVYEWDLG